MADHQVAVERGDDEVDYIARWLDGRTRDEVRGERRMRFRDLRRVLEEQGCVFDPPKANFVKIRRETPGGTLSVKAGYPNEHHEVPPNEVRRFRRALLLDEGHGYDSGAFYDFEASVDGFANTYRQLLNRLADR